jgi:hypothetical protein
MKEWERIARARPILHRTVDIHDRPIYTDEQMFTYLQQFERDFAASAARVIDATEGGVRKKGAAVMPLREALEHYARRDVPGPLRHRESEPRAHATWTDPHRLPRAAAELRARLGELAEFRELCRETSDLLSEMTGLLDRPAEFDRRIIRVDELRCLVEQRGRIFRMVSDVSQQAEIQKISADRRLAFDRSRAERGGGAMEDVERARRQLERDARFVEALLEGCDVLEKILSEALRRADALIEETAAP